MGVPASLNENFSEWGGLDYRSNDKTRPPRFARQVENVELLKNNSLSNRRGQKGRAPSKGGGGTKTYVRSLLNVETEELITIDSNLWRLKEGTITITYSGAAASVVASLLPVDNGDGTYTFRFVLTEDDVVALDTNLGTGISETAPVSIATLVTAIDALATFGCTATGTTTGPAAFLPNISGSTATTGLAITFEYWEQIYSPTTNPFSTFFATVNDDSFQNATLINHNNTLYICTGKNKLYKYDGLQAFAAGMPFATTYSAAAAAGGALIAGDYDSFITYAQIDANGIEIEGDPSVDDVTTLSGGNLQITHTIPTIQTSSQFLTSFALAANGGTQTGVTLTVDDGAGGAHTLQVGQSAFFRDNAGVLQTDIITARAAGSITFANSYTIANNAVISANLIIRLWRNKAGGDLPYLVREFANDPSVASFTYTDNIADSALDIFYEEPIEGHGEPPENMRYATVYDNNLILNDGTDEVWTSDTDGSEYFNTSFYVKSKSNRLVKALGANREILAVFKGDETHVINGDIVNGQFQNKLLADAIGCDSHEAVIDIDTTLWFYSGSHGMRRIVSNRIPDDVSYRILPAITSKRPLDTQRLVHERTVAVYVKDYQIALFFVPTETDTGSYIYANENSVVFAADVREQMDTDEVYDEQGRLLKSFPRIRWWRWSGMNMLGGATLYDGELVWTQRGYNDNTAANEFPLIQRLTNGDQYDYCDHAQPYDTSYEGGWDDRGKADLEKKFIAMVFYSFPEDGLAPSFTMTASTEFDFKNGVSHSVKEITFGENGVSSGWGNWGWGDVAWGELTNASRLFTLKPRTGRALKPVIASSIFLTQMVISGWTLEVVAAFQPHIKEPRG